MSGLSWASQLRRGWAPFATRPGDPGRDRGSGVPTSKGLGSLCNVTPASAPAFFARRPNFEGVGLPLQLQQAHLHVERVVPVPTSKGLGSLCNPPSEGTNNIKELDGQFRGVLASGHFAALMPSQSSRSASVISDLCRLANFAARGFGFRSAFSSAAGSPITT